jgi:hypothetical protein
MVWIGKTYCVHLRMVLHRVSSAGILMPDELKDHHRRIHPALIGGSGRAGAGVSPEVHRVELPLPRCGTYGRPARLPVLCHGLSDDLTQVDTQPLLFFGIGPGAIHPGEKAVKAQRWRALIRCCGACAADKGDQQYGKVAAHCLLLNSN